MPRFLKSAPLLILLGCAALQADPILVGPIEISGSGSFAFYTPYNDFADTGTSWSLSFSGSNGADSVSAFQIEAPERALPGLNNLFGSTSPTGGMTIDGISTICSTSCNYGEFLFQNVGPGEYAGTATIFDSTGNALIQASLVGNLIITSESDILHNPDGSVGLALGTFAIVNAPEPAALSLVGFGIAALLLSVRRQKL